VAEATALQAGRPFAGNSNNNNKKKKKKRANAQAGKRHDKAHIAILTHVSNA